MHRDRNDRRRALLRQAVWLAAGSVAVLLTVRALPDDDAVEALGAATTALRAAETALDDAAVDIGAAAEVQRGQDAGAAESDPMSDAARRAESAARAAGRASTEARTVVTRVRHMRMEQSGTFAEAVAALRALRDAARALMAAVEALRNAAEALRDAGAVRAAHRALVAADDILDAADTVVQATKAALDGDERFTAPAGQTRGADGAPGQPARRSSRFATAGARNPARRVEAPVGIFEHLQRYPPPPAAAARSSARAPLSTFVRL